MVDMKIELSRGDFSLYTVRTMQSMFEEDAFTDITLASEDNKQIKAHKSVLSSGSNFFRDIILQNPHPHPLIYLRLPYGHLVSLVRFMYLGQCEVEQTDIDDFLENAKHLKVAGLCMEIETDVKEKKKELRKNPTELNHLQSQISVPVVMEDPLEQMKAPNKDTIADNSGIKDILKLEVEDSSKKYICPMCNQNFLDIANLKAHIENHGVEKVSANENYKQNNIDVQDYSMILPSRQNETFQFICNLCGHEEFCEASLAVHKKKLHPEEISASEPKRQLVSKTLVDRKRVFAMFNSYIAEKTFKTVDEILTNHEGKDIMTELFFGFFASFTLKENSINRNSQKEGKRPALGYLNTMKSAVKNTLIEEYNFHFEHRDPEFMNRWKKIEGMK